jgi:6-phosphogluconolactonase
VRLVRFERAGSWLQAGLAEFIAAAERAKRAGRSACHFCLAGGLTPAPLYRLLAGSAAVAAAFEGLAVNLWLGDEREVPAGSPDRNGRLVADSFRDAKWRHQVRLWPEGPAAVSASSYAAELESALGPRPAWDLCLLGLGADGHTASLFPGQPVLAETRALAAASLAPFEPHQRMSLTLPALKSALKVCFFARGADKRPVVEALARGGSDLPASALDSPNTFIIYLEKG